MNIFERQNELGRSLFQINANTLRSLAEMQRDNIEKYFELNADYWEKLPDVKDLSGFLELQRTYNESVWSGVRESARTQADLFKEALEETGDALKVAFRPDEEEPKKARSSTRKRAPRKAKASPREPAQTIEVGG